MSFKHLATTGSQLHIAIDIEDALISVSRRIFQYSLRSHLRYLNRVLRRFKVDVTLISPSDEHLAPVLHRKLESQMGCHRYIFNCHHVKDYEAHIRRVVSLTQGRMDRVLYVTTKGHLKFFPAQTLVVDKIAGKQRVDAPAMDSEPRRSDKKIVKVRDDFTLIALAEIVKDMALTDAPVSEMIKVDPLIEKYRVPHHGWVNVLPAENCDHIDELDLDKLECSLPDGAERVGDFVYGPNT